MKIGARAGNDDELVVVSATPWASGACVGAPPVAAPSRSAPEPWSVAVSIAVALRRGRRNEPRCGPISTTSTGAGS
jgi:hypothetical protein